MAQEHADRLIKDLKSNKDLHDKVAEAAQKVIDVAKEHGYDVSVDEVRTAVNSHHGLDIPKTTDGEEGADPMTCFVLSETPGA
ncbi:MAG: Nif11-like leader peptide family natural product precursor [Acidobacteriota bacterium]